jgi:hypothetical protein
MPLRFNTLTRKLLVTTVLAWAVLLNLRFFVSAGPLWRDEANSVQQASLPDWSAVRDSLQYDSFPVLYPVILRAWLSVPSLNGDLALRSLGLLTGLCLLISMYLVCRLFGSRCPFVVLVLLAINPVLISEACSIRPYGLTLIVLLWAFAGLGMCVERPSRSWLSVAALASVVAVQLSYSSGLFVAVFGLTGATLATRRGELRRAPMLLVPGIVAALTLLPYRPVLARATEWVMLLRSRVDWGQFFTSYTKEHTIAPVIGWAVFLVLAGLTVVSSMRNGRAPLSASATVPYAVGVAVLSLLAQVLFVEYMKVPPFPRYFLPALLFAGIALQLLLDQGRHLSHVLAAVLVLLLTARPAWSWLGLQRTNMDEVAHVLQTEARAGDLIILSPWFLHPSFQRYYHGQASWITVPDLPATPITRYDLFENAMFIKDSTGGLTSRLLSTLDKGGRFWLVHQAIGYVPDQASPPDAPAVPSQLGGEDYVRYRSYWEREIWFLLRSCCLPRDFPVTAPRSVWDEERLLLTVWNAGERTGKRRLKIERK